LTLPEGRRIVLDEVRSVYWRQYHGVDSPELPDNEQSFIAQNDSRSLFESFLMQLPARWVNGWRGFRLHQTKPAALSLVAELGVPIPATLCTNDPHAVRDFVARHPQVIFKPVQGGAHTRRFTAAHLKEEHLANLRYAPVTLQEEIRGTNVRVFVAGHRVFGCELHTDELDYRDSPDVQIRVCTLTDDFQKTCIQIARRLELIWSGMDFVRTREGQFVFLEANPSPMFLGFEQQSGLPLTDSLAELLKERHTA
jgi:glutathione synthase/RimK-type ligase-like ATP-grasp enzyme